MVIRVSRLALLGSLAGVPLVLLNCGGEDRNFAKQPAGTGGAGKDGGGASGSSGAMTGGSAGSGGTAGASTTDGGKACTSADECNDRESCNGSETCSGGVCRSGTPVANGTSCTPVVGSGDGGEVYVCANGNCLARCTTDAECEDNDVCTGNEICSPATTTCTSGTPLACSDSNACTDDKCDPDKGCFYPLIDVDLDGHAAEALGPCGDDCDDNDKTVYRGAAELCDNKDNNCNTQRDELAPSWYVDCDKDTFAPAGAASIQQCAVPTTSHASCGVSGGWTSTAPTTGTTDCWDSDAKARPYSAAENTSAWQTMHIPAFPSTTADDDWNCDKTEEQRYTTSGVAGSAACTSGVGGIGGIGGITGLDEETAAQAAAGAGGIIVRPPLCYGSTGWTTATAPACQTNGTWSTCGYNSVQGKCLRSSSSRPQECR